MSDRLIMELDKEVSKVVNELSNQLTIILDTVHKTRQDLFQHQAEMNNQLSEAIMILNSRLVKIEEYLEVSRLAQTSYDNTDIN